MLTAIFCGIAAYVLYKIFSMFNSNEILSSKPRTSHNNPQEVRQSEKDLREMQLLEQQRAHDNKRTAVAGLTGALAGAALAHHLDKDNEQNNLNAALAAQQQQEASNIAAADDAGMDYDEFLNTDRTYDRDGHVIDYDDNNDLSDDNDDDYSDDSTDDDSYDSWSDDDGSSYDDNDHDDWNSNGDGGFFDDSGDGGDWF